jgi:stage IV sporulation protein B
MTKAYKIVAITFAALLLNIYINTSYLYISQSHISPTFNTYSESIEISTINDSDCPDKCALNYSGKDLPTIKTRESVYVGGMPLGFEFKTLGLIIIGKTEVVTDKGLVDPNKDNDIEVGDILLKIDGQEVNTAEELTKIVNLEHNQGRALSAQLKRQSQNIETKINSVKDLNGVYKTGLWIRQDTFGVGTLTFVRQNNRFAALGHPVIDADTKNLLLITGGNVLNCSIAGCVKGERGKPGEIKGLIMKNNKPFGTIDKNSVYGVYGQLDEIPQNDLYKEPIEIMPRSKVKPGKAYILTTLCGSTPQKFEIMIVKTNFQAKPSDRSMVIKITDSRLLSVTGGIVQGMSGSPIIQDEKLCGAVTHVFVNDPTRGYGLYADWMLNQ